MKNKGFAESNGIRLEFLSAAKKPYVDKGGSIYVSKAATLDADPRLIRAHADPQTRAIIFPDELPNKKILAELDAIAKLQKPELRRYAEIYFKGFVGGGQPFAFDDKANRLTFAAADYPNLVADIERTQSILGAIFNERHSVNIRRFNPKNTRGDNWHRDAYLSPEKSFATRTFGDRGTLIARGRIAFEHDAGPFTLNKAAHAGQGVYLFHGNTVHGIPKIEKGRRWVYIFT